VGIIAEEDDEEAAHENEERCAGRVGDLESIATGDEFAAIPKAADGLHGQDVNGAGNETDDPAGDEVEAAEVTVGDSSLHMSELWRFFTKESAGCQEVADQVVAMRSFIMVYGFDTINVRV
jgi:hypothetical protein